MKRLFKKLLVVVSTCIMSALLIVSVTGCRPLDTDSSESSTKTEIVPKISFSVSEKALLIGDEEYLFPNYEKIAGFTLRYTTSDASIVDVSERGKIIAISEGVATITATYSNGETQSEASLQVTSSFGGYLPELKTMGVDNDIAITVNDSYMVLPYILFNGKEIDGGTFTYSIANTAIAEVNENGEITAKARGMTELVINASWCGKDKTNTPTMQKTVTLSVIDDVKFFNNGIPLMNETIYTLSEFEGVAYKNSIPYNFKVSVSGAEEDAEVFIQNEEILVRQGDYLVANAFGKTEVTVEKEVEGILYSKTFEVEVCRIEKTVTETVPLFNMLDGLYLEAQPNLQKQVLSFIGVEDEAVDAYQNGKALTVEDGRIFGITSSTEITRGLAEVTVGTDAVLYHFTLETLTKAINTKEDLMVLQLSNGQVIKGYYEVIADIDATGVSLNHQTLNNACFAGVFNGGGHVISNLALLQESSMFGVLSSAATVKNFALTNLYATKAYFLAENTLDDSGLTMSNLYIQLDSATVSPRGLTGRTGQTSVCKNIVIEYLGENAAKNRTYEDRYAWQGLIGGMWRRADGDKYYAQDKNWKDVYVISPFVVSFRADEAVDKNNPELDGQIAVYGYGANETVDLYGNSLESSVHTRPNPDLGPNWWRETYVAAQYTNLYHYNDYSALKNSSSDYDSFSDEYWVVYDNQICWKSLFADRITVKAFADNKAMDASGKLSTKGAWLDFKAYVDGVAVDDSNVTVTIAPNEYITWETTSLLGFTLKEGWRVSKLPAKDTATVEVKLTIAFGNVTFTKTLTLTLQGNVVTPIQPGGNYEAEGDYDED